MACHEYVGRVIACVRMRCVKHMSTDRITVDVHWTTDCKVLWCVDVGAPFTLSLGESISAHLRLTNITTLLKMEFCGGPNLVARQLSHLHLQNTTLFAMLGELLMSSFN